MSEYITKFRTTDGDKQLDYRAIGNLQDMDPSEIGAYPASRSNLANVDLNNYIGKDYVGTYLCNPNCTNAPFGNYFYLEVNAGVQRATHIDTGNVKSRTYLIRNNDGQKTWSEWGEPNGLQGHLNNTNNPHGVTWNQIGAYPAVRDNLSNVDLNNYKGAENVGTYWCKSNITNAPFSDFFYLEVNGSSQRATNYPSGKIKSRGYINEAWSEWKEPVDLQGHLDNKSNPHGVTATQVGATPIQSISKLNASSTDTVFSIIQSKWSSLPQVLCGNISVNRNGNSFAALYTKQGEDNGAILLLSYAISGKCIVAYKLSGGTWTECTF